MGEIQAAYLALAKEYHPDKLINATASVRKMVTSKMQEINGAYAILKQRGYSPRPPKTPTPVPRPRRNCYRSGYQPPNQSSQSSHPNPNPYRAWGVPPHPYANPHGRTNTAVFSWKGLKTTAIAFVVGIFCLLLAAAGAGSAAFGLGLVYYLHRRGLFS
jgi:hypothetical protein